MSESDIYKDTLNKIKGLMDEGKSYTEAVEQLTITPYTIEEIKRYSEMKKIILDFRKKLETEAGYIGVMKKAERMIKTGIPLTDNNIQRIYTDIQITLERKDLIAITSKKILDKELVLDEHLIKYLLSNFHRTLCELSLKLFSEPLFFIIPFIIDKINTSSVEQKEKDRKMIYLNKIKENLIKNRFGLDDLLTIIGNLEKYTNVSAGMLKIIKESLAYEEIGGFVTRNDTAHERKLFEQMNSKDLMDKVMKANLFNMAFLMAFFLEGVDPALASDVIKNVL